MISEAATRPTQKIENASSHSCGDGAFNATMRSHLNQKAFVDLRSGTSRAA